MRKLIFGIIASIFIVACAGTPVPARAALPSTTSRVTATGNGTTRIFSFGFKTFQTSHVEVFINEVKQTSGITVVLNANQDTTPGGTITFTYAPESGAAIRIDRTLPLTQGSVWASNSPFQSKTIEKTYDTGVMQAQQLDRKIGDEHSAWGAADTLLDGKISAEAAARQAADNDLRAAIAASPGGGGGAIGDYSSVLTTGSTTARTLRDRFADLVNVKDFGAQCNGVADDTAALQSAINAAKPGSTVQNAAGYGQNMTRVYIPKGRCIISSPLLVYTGVWVDGVGNGSMIEAGGTFPANEAIFKASDSGLSPPGFYNGKITNLRTKAAAGTGIWTFSHSAMSSAGTLTADSLLVETPKGFDLTPYSQNSWVRNVIFLGNVDQMVRLKGNFNMIEQLDKEGSTGSTTDPYILVQATAAGSSAQNHFRQILIEQATSANKTLISASDTDGLILENLWLEPTLSDGYGIRLANCVDFQIRGRLVHLLSSNTKLKLSSASWGSIETLNTDGDDVPWQSVVEIEAGSYVHNGKLFSRRSDGAFTIDNAGRYDHAAVIDRTLIQSPAPGVVPVSRPRAMPAQNLLVNPSFEVGAYGWTQLSPSVTNAFVASEVAPGLMLDQTAAAGSFSSYQTISVPAAWAGRLMTFSFLAKTTSSTGGFITPYLWGPGVDLGQQSFRVINTDGWVLVSVSFTPNAAGNLSVGWYAANMSAGAHFYIDEVRLAFGSEGTPAGGRFQQIELGNKSVTSLSAAPTAGTWKVGDIVFNSAPAAGGPMGWMCVTAGTPGTWKAMANLEP